jgi:putative transposase
MQSPASRYDPSPRRMPNRLPPLEYLDRFEVSDVSAHGGIRWNHQWVNASPVGVRAYIGLEDIDDGVWNVYFGPRRRGRLLERRLRIKAAYDRLKRRRRL